MTRVFSRDDLYAALLNMGINAQLASRGRSEEKIGGRGSLGLIEILQGDIRWCNVRRRIHWWYSITPPVEYSTEFGVPDLRLGQNLPQPRLQYSLVKSFPIFGRFVDLHWKGKDFSLGIIGRLNSDSSIKRTLISNIGVSIDAHAKHRCWIISIGSSESLPIPSVEQWSCYQSIARHLLSEWPK